MATAAPDRLLDSVTTVADRLVAAGERHGGLFPSVLDRESGRRVDLPPNVPGQRDGDRAPHGCNLAHDAPVLRAMDALDEAGVGDYAPAVDRYVAAFATRCTDTATGLFPWGEHAYWDLAAERVGDSKATADGDRYRPIHDHLRLTPRWLWARIHEHRPAAVHEFADGLCYHWNRPHEPEYIRHAPIAVKDREGSGRRACDFPRHAGFYAHDWAFAYTRQPHPDYRRRIRAMSDYWWEKRDPAHRGLLRFESRGRTDELSPRQTLGHAVGLLDAAALLAEECAGDDEAAALCETLRERAATYLDGFLAAPHDPDADRFLGTCRERDLESGTFEPRTGPDVTYEIRPMAVWGDVYSGVLAAPMGLLAIAGYRHTGDDRLLAWARGVGETYASTPFPDGGVIDPEAAHAVMNPSTEQTMARDEGIPVHARDPGHALGLLADLHDVTGEDRWLDAALRLAERVLPVYLDAPLPRGAAGVDHYENQLGTGFLLAGLARTALLARDGPVPLGPDYTER